MKHLSIFKKLLVPLVPLTAMGLIVGGVAWQALRSSTAELMASVAIEERAFQAMLYASEMSDAMRGYLLDPSNDAEARRKIEADEKLGKSLAEMKTLTRDKELLSLVEALAEHDETKLNPAENRVLKIVRQGKIKEAQANYNGEYVPLHRTYNEMASKLVNLAEHAARQEAARVDQSIQRALWLIVGSLALGILVTGGFLVRTASGLSGILTSLSERFSIEADQLASASNEVLKTGTELAEGSTEQSAALQETVASVEEINAMLERTAINASQSKDLARSSEQAIVQGQESVAQVHRAMDRINTSNQEILGRIEANTREISEIVSVINEINTKTKVINDIVFQTKLLSFNASVEAARAGEHGKGFAVVAEEVGNLAAMSGKAAVEITGLLEASIRRVEEIVEKNRAQSSELVSKGRAMIEEGSRSVQGASDAFDGIRKDASGVRTALDEIATAASEQKQGIQEVSKAITQLEQVSQRSAAISQQSSAMSSQLSAQAGKLRAMVDDLIVLVRGTALAAGAGSGDTGTGKGGGAPGKPQFAEVIALKPSRNQAAPATEMKKAAGAESVPAADDARFVDV